MLEFMHSRWLYLVAALLSVAVTIALRCVPTAQLEPVPALATPHLTDLIVVAPVPDSIDAIETSARTGVEAPAINLALVIDVGERWPTLPQDPDARLLELAAAAEAGAPDAADDLYLLVKRCSANARLPLPSTEQAYVEARDRLVQTHTFFPHGRVVGRIEGMLDLLEQGYRLCSTFKRLNLPGHAYWNRVGVELGSHYAMMMYWSAQTGTEDWEAVQMQGIAYLERARDEGYVPAFFNIGLMQGERIPDGPYNPDYTEALAHFYALIELGNAIRTEGAQNPRSWRAGTLRVRQGTRFVRELEMQVSPYQIQVARERADELLDRCCR